MKLSSALFRDRSSAGYQFRTALVVIAGSFVNLYATRNTPMFAFAVGLMVAAFLLLFYSVWKLKRQGSL